MEVVLYFLIAIVAMVILVKLFSWPLKILGKLILNGALGVFLLLLVNFIGGSVDIIIPINAVSALIAGFLGVPGVIFLIIFNKLM
ncbi:pro-sigmaK processing inhibitor BofA family protein [Clostridium estertheticum]|uniref:pro-sigmaK processing inhibitor BofA family protein n=1 Tax=Clostridium estertheticum TaxID=238834 RepID=UPI0013E940F6|nr:pro-sigmaK processing inhibitor BofA family protein [Clostridium estertheticum]MBZ9684837.1 pro-sigmaK processing inhibitor BofA family protein [Clostridium estertheticum]